MDDIGAVVVTYLILLCLEVVYVIAFSDEEGGENTFLSYFLI